MGEGELLISKMSVTRIAKLSDRCCTPSSREPCKGRLETGCEQVVCEVQDPGQLPPAPTSGVRAAASGPDL